MWPKEGGASLLGKLLLNWAGENMPLHDAAGGTREHQPKLSVPSQTLISGNGSPEDSELGAGMRLTQGHMPWLLAENPMAVPFTPGCLLFGKYLSSTSCVQGAVGLRLALCSYLVLCLLPHLPILPLSPGSLSLVFPNTAHTTLLGSFPWAPASQGTAPIQCPFWKL